ncbi:acetyltransferase [Levilactobacillus brevis]|uniref:Acetyltransferase n=1 Tax=Levilactobacillus hammesii TaxID=267633 RepID=A0A921F2E4_9LACO|nr:acetyltransferase [Levilactobacillus brevis]HJE87315.1 acetyltransferase [Levilactobacillus hammesii]
MKLAEVWNQMLPGATVRPLTHADDDLIYAFQAAHPAYFNHFQDHPVTRNEAIQDVTDVPMNAMPDQKAYLGIFQGDQLVVLVDLIIDYPLPSLVWLGMWMTDDQLATEQAADYYRSLVATLRAAGAVQLQLSVFMGDREMKRFWEGQQLQAIQTTTVVRGDRTANVTIYQDKF